MLALWPLLSDKSLGYEVRAYPADWRGKGKRAGILRNLAMLDAEPDLVIAFQRNGSTGTQHTIDEARRRGIAVEVHTEQGSEPPYPWCIGAPSRAACAAAGYCKRNPNCGE